MNQKNRQVLIVLSCVLIPEIASIGCADQCADMNCPEGTECVLPQPYVTMGSLGSTKTVTPGPECVGPTNYWGAGEADALTDAGLVIELVDGGSCSLVAEDAGGCTTCMLSACCTEATACFKDGGACSPTDPVGTMLATCITNHCAAQCPGVP